MANESIYESDISESWSLVDINLNESGNTTSEAYSIRKKNENFSNEAENNELDESRKYNFEEICLKHTKDDENENIESQKLKSSFPEAKLNFSIHKKQDWKDVSSDESKSDSCDGESIEILDIDENYICEDPDNCRVGFTIVGDDGTNDINHSNNKNFDNSNLTVLYQKRKRRNSNSGSESSSSCLGSNSDVLYCGEINSNLNLNVNKKMDEEIRMEGNKINTKPIYKHYRNNFTNTALSLSLGVIFAGVACIAIGHFLGVHDASKTADELMNTLKKLQSENFALQSRLSELDKGFTSKNRNVEVKLQLNKINSHCDFSRKIEELEQLTNENKDVENSELNDDGTLNSFEWFVKFQNLMKSKIFNQNQHFNDFKKVVFYIHDQLSLLNFKSKNYMKLKNLEEKYYKISKMSQKILRKLASSHENLESSYHKLIDLRDNLNKKLSKILAEVSENFCTSEQRISNICKDKKSVIKKINCEFLKCETENEIIDNLTNNSLVMYMFPQQEEYYLGRNNSLISNLVPENINLYKSSVAASSNRTYSKKSETKDESHKTFLDTTMSQKNCERTKSDLSSLPKNEKKSNTKKEKNKSEKKVRKKKEEQVNNGNERVRRNMKSIKFNEKSGEFNTKEKSNFYKNCNIKINKVENKKKKNWLKNSEKEHRLKSRFVKKKGKSSKFRRVFKLKIIKKNSYEVKNNGTRFSENRNFLSGNYSNYFNATGNWFFKWATGREQSRYHQGLGDWQFDRAKARKILRNEDLNINWHLKRAVARQNNRNQNELNNESYEQKNYGDKSFYHEEFSWM